MCWQQSLHATVYNDIITYPVSHPATSGIPKKKCLRCLSSQICNESSDYKICNSFSQIKLSRWKGILHSVQTVSLLFHIILHQASFSINCENAIQNAVPYHFRSNYSILKMFRLVNWQEHFGCLLLMCDSVVDLSSLQDAKWASQIKNVHSFTLPFMSCTFWTFTIYVASVRSAGSFCSGLWLHQKMIDIDQIILSDGSRLWERERCLKDEGCLEGGC